MDNFFVDFDYISLLIFKLTNKLHLTEYFLKYKKDERLFFINNA